jgi:hypothetical protein
MLLRFLTPILPASLRPSIDLAQKRRADGSSGDKNSVLAREMLAAMTVPTLMSH